MKNHISNKEQYSEEVSKLLVETGLISNDELKHFKDYLLCSSI
jgi:hypothetical protein